MVEGLVKSCQTTKQRKYKMFPKKAHPISFGELSIIFSKTLGDFDLESLSFVKICFNYDVIDFVFLICEV